jgi:hypothetical protein
LLRGPSIDCIEVRSHNAMTFGHRRRAMSGIQTKSDVDCYRANRVFLPE